MVLVNAVRDILGSATREISFGALEAFRAIVIRLVFPGTTAFAIGHHALDELLRQVRILRQLQPGMRSWRALLDTSYGQFTSQASGDVMLGAFKALQLAGGLGVGAQGTGLAAVGVQVMKGAARAFHYLEGNACLNV